MNEGFRSLHPLPGFLYYAGMMLTAMLLLHPVFLAGALLLLAAINFAYETKESMLRTMLISLVIGTGLLVLNPLFSHRGAHILFYMLDQPVTWESVCYGITITLSTLTIILTFMSFRQVVTTDKFLYLFSYVWPKGTLILVMGMRFVPLLTSRLRTITEIQRSKGISLTQGPLKDRAGAGMSILQILLTWSLEEALQTADSMKARGYGIGPRSSYASYRMRRRDWYVLGFICIAAVGSLIGRLWGWGYLKIYPSAESWGFSDPKEWISFLCYLLFVSTPLLVDGREWLRWRLLK